MIKLGMRMIQRPPLADKLIKNINFGTAVGLTRTAKEGQAAVVGALAGTFTLRGRWFEQGNKFGIKIKPAKRDDLSAEVRTQADWLEIHEKGGQKTARGGRVAVPTGDVRRNKRAIIQKSQRPRNLKNTFVLETAHGPVLAQRITRGKNKGIRILYGLEPKVQIRKQSTFYAPIDNVVKRRLDANIRAEIEKALRTMR